MAKIIIVDLVKLVEKHGRMLGLSQVNNGRNQGIIPLISYLPADSLPISLGTTRGS